MRKSHLNDEFLVLLGPIISRLFTCSNEEKKLKKKKQRVLALVLSLWFLPSIFTMTHKIVTDTCNATMHDNKIVSLSAKGPCKLACFIMLVCKALSRSSTQAHRAHS